VKTALKSVFFDDVMDKNKLGSFLFMHCSWSVYYT